MLGRVTRMRLRVAGFGVVLLCSVALAQSQQPSSSSSDQVQTQPAQGTLDSQSPKAGGQATQDSRIIASGTQTRQVDADSKPGNESKDKIHFRLGTVTLGAGYTHFANGLLFSPFSPYGFYPYGVGYSAFFYDTVYSPFYDPYWPGFNYSVGKGQVKLATDRKTAEVYLDGAYAGMAGSLKSMWLDPGAYDLTLAAPDGAAFHQRVYVLSGKSLRIKAKLVRQDVQERAQEKVEKQP